MKVKTLCIGITSSIIAIAGLGLCLPNVIWLRHSTIKITNQGTKPLDMASVQVGNETLNYKAIEPGAFQFSMLPRTSHGSLAIMLPPSHQLGSFCHTYIEGKMYHVDVTVNDGKVVSCQASLPLLSNFWVFKALLK